MKKIGMLLAIVGVMMFTFAGSAMAELDTGDVTVTATVAEYAEIRDLEGFSVAVAYASTGYAGTGSDLFTVESNCAVTVTADATVDLEQGTEQPVLEASIAITNGTATANGIITPTITATVGTTEGIDDRSSGDYTGIVTVTVSTS